MHYRIRHVAAAACLLASANLACAQSHEGHVAGMTHGARLAAMPVETGQAAFAALAEIVAILDADPETDWSRVDIDALRDHLADMDQLTLHAQVETQALDGGRVRFEVTGDDQTRKAIQAMVPVHAGMVRDATGWSIVVDQAPDGVVLIIDAQSPEARTRLKALGFFGFMTLGAHHQAHHLQIARGLDH